MKRFLAIFVGANAIILAGCASNISDVPLSVAYPRAAQHKMQAAYHWDILAKYQADLILRAINDLNKPIFIDCTFINCRNGNTEVIDGMNSPFNEAYHVMLQSHLVKKGAMVVNKPVSGNVLVSYTAQVLEHTDRARVDWETDLTTRLKVNPDISVPIWHYNIADSTEVMVTTQVLEGTKILYSSTDMFYYNAGDTRHYFVPRRPKNPAYSSVTFRVTDETGH